MDAKAGWSKHRGRGESRRLEREERQPEDQAHHQAAELVRAIPVLGLQPQGAAEGVLHDLHLHRNARSGEYLPYPSRCNIVIKKAGAKLFDLQSGRELPSCVKGGTTVFEVLHEPRPYNVYRFE